MSLKLADFECPKCGDTQAAWAAGFVDGEGCITFGTRGNLYPRVCASQKFREPLDHIRDVLGGVVVALKPWANGAQYYEWSANGSVAIAALKVMLPYLRLKREQAELVIMSQNTPWRKNRGKGSRKNSGRTQAQVEIDGKFHRAVAEEKRFPTIRREGRG